MPARGVPEASEVTATRLPSGCQSEMPSCDPGFAEKIFFAPLPSALMVYTSRFFRLLGSSFVEKAS